MGDALVTMVETVGQRVKEIKFSTYHHPKDRAVCVFAVPLERFGEVKSALEDIFGPIEVDYIT